MTEHSQDDIVLAAAKAANNACYELGKLQGFAEALPWVDLSAEEQHVKIEVTKNILGLPTDLDPAGTYQIGDVNLFVTTARTFLSSLGYGVLVQFAQPQFIVHEPEDAGPVIEHEPLEQLDPVDDLPGTGIEQDDGDPDLADVLAEFDEAGGDPAAETNQGNDNGGGAEPAGTAGN